MLRRLTKSFLHSHGPFKQTLATSVQMAPSLTDCVDSTQYRKRSINCRQPPDEEESGQRTLPQGQGVASLEAQNHLGPLAKSYSKNFMRIPIVTCVEGVISSTSNKQFLDNIRVCKNSTQF